MKYFREFNTEADKNAWLIGSEFVTPNVVLTEGVLGYNVKIDHSLLPLHIEAIEDLTIKFSNNYEYSKDSTTWLSGKSSTTISASAGERVFFRATGLTASSTSGIGSFTISKGMCNIGGNIMSMVYGTDFKGKFEITQAYQFYLLFADEDKVVDASALVLPAMTLANYCYYDMFRGCTSLVNAPELPATTLANGCYGNMFQDCTSLANVPAISAITLASTCYESMFEGCTSLVNAPELPATTLVQYCYYFMFKGCTSLVNAPDLPATTLDSSCYSNMFEGCTSLGNAPELPATTLKKGCYNSMFEGCTSLVNAPELPATTLAANCYANMFKDCTSLVNAPELPTINLVANFYCYYGMFSGCTSLNYIKAMFTTDPSTSYMGDWVNGVSATGTFVKNSAATWENTYGTSAIPEGWTVELADA